MAADDGAGWQSRKVGDGRAAPADAAPDGASSEAAGDELGGADLGAVADLRNNIRSLSQRISIAARSSRKRSMAELR